MKMHLFVALAATLVSATASAQGYGVLAAGLSRLSGACSGATACDVSDTAVKLIGGYKFTKDFAGELTYFDFGKSSASGSGVSGEVKNVAVGGSVAFHQDGTDSHFVARLGLARVKTKVSGTIAGVGSAGDSDSNIALATGLGAGFKWSKTVSIDGSWDYTRAKYNKNGVNESGSINFLSIGVTFWY